MKRLRWISLERPDWAVALAILLATCLQTALIAVEAYNSANARARAAAELAIELYQERVDERGAVALNEDDITEHAMCAVARGAPACSREGWASLGAVPLEADSVVWFGYRRAPLSSALQPQTWAVFLIGVSLAAMVWRIERAHAKDIGARLGEIGAVLTSVEASADLSLRVPSTGKEDQIAGLAHQVNAALDRMEGRMRGFADLAKRVSHEMMEPLARVALALRASPDAETARNNALDRLDIAIQVFRTIVSLAERQRREGDGLRRVAIDDILSEKAHLWSQSSKAISKNLEFQLDRESAWVMGSPGELALLLDNLVSNAVKYCREDGVIQLLCQPGAQLKLRHVTLSIIDEGPGLAGFPAGWRDGRGGRGPSAEGEDGSGVGLGFAMAIAKSHGGRIDIKDRNDGIGGAHVTVVLPMVDGRAGVPHEQAAQQNGDDVKSQRTESAGDVVVS